MPKAQGTERGDIKALKEVQSNSLYNSPIKEDTSDNYLYAAKVIKLTEQDFRKWEKLALVDEDSLAAYLDSRDIWLQQQPEEKRNKWFMSTEIDLKNGGASRVRPRTSARG